MIWGTIRLLYDEDIADDGDTDDDDDDTDDCCWDDSCCELLLSFVLFAFHCLKWLIAISTALLSDSVPHDVKYISFWGSRLLMSLPTCSLCKNYEMRIDMMIVRQWI